MIVDTDQHIALFKRRGPVRLEVDEKRSDERWYLERALQKRGVDALFEVAEQCGWGVSANFETRSHLFGQVNLTLPDMQNPIVMRDGQDPKRLNEIRLYRWKGQGRGEGSYEPISIDSLNQKIQFSFSVERTNDAALSRPVEIRASVHHAGCISICEGLAVDFSLSRFISEEERSIIHDRSAYGVESLVSPFSLNIGTFGLDRFKNWELMPFEGSVRKELIYGALGEACALFAKAREAQDGYFVLAHAFPEGAS